MNMNSFIDSLRQKRQSFSITVTCDNLDKLMLECFLSHPELLSALPFHIGTPFLETGTQ